MLFRVAYSSDALADVRELRSYITQEVSRRTANQYIAKFKKFCGDLSLSLNRGENRPRLPKDQQTIGFKGRTSVAFEVDTPTK